MKIVSKIRQVITMIMESSEYVLIISFPSKKKKKKKKKKKIWCDSKRHFI
jgi:vacuolar-type H+-ATPase subunit F/Vma7